MLGVTDLNGTGSEITRVGGQPFKRDPMQIQNYGRAQSEWAATSYDILNKV
jgi:hypothetical protein